MSGKIKVLLVDDHALFRRGMRLLFNTCDDLEVIGEAESGEEALQFVMSAKPDIVLMDVDMPGDGGVATTAAIRATTQSRVLILTGHRRYVAASIRAGANGYVLKGANDEELIDAIRAIHCSGFYLQAEIVSAVVKILQQEMPVSLTEREIAVLRFAAVGAENKEIGKKLSITEHRVKQHMSDILRKLGANDRTHAVAIALREGLIV